MFARLLAGLVLSFSPAAGHAAEAAVDLSAQFPPIVSQGGVGACHDFVTVALLEAAIYRRHGEVQPPGQPAGGRLRLSAADLFVRRTVASFRYFESIQANLKAGLELQPAVRDSEGGHVKDDLRFALREGLASEALVPWARVSGRYKNYRDEVSKPMLAKCKAMKQRVLDEVHASKVERRERLLAAKARCYAEWSHEVLTLERYLERSAGQDTPEAERRLLGDVLDLPVERAWVREKLLGSYSDDQAYPGADAALRKDVGRCRESGLPQRKAILKRLGQGIPIALSMDLLDLPEWGGAKGYHGFVVTGYRMAGEKGDRYVFLTRNSWGGKNPEVPEDRLCRVFATSAVVTDQEEF